MTGCLTCLPTNTTLCEVQEMRARVAAFVAQHCSTNPDAGVGLRCRGRRPNRFDLVGQSAAPPASWFARLLVNVYPSPVAGDGLVGNWCGTDLGWRLHTALLVNELTLSPVLLHIAPAASFAARIPGAVAETLAAHGVPAALFDSETKAMADIVWSKTQSRSHVGTKPVRRSSISRCGSPRSPAALCIGVAHPRTANCTRWSPSTSNRRTIVESF